MNATLTQRGLPVAAANYLATAQPAGPMFNPYNWGGYLSWRLYPEYPVYIDGRTDVYDAAFFTEYLRLAAGLPGWTRILDGHGVRLMLVEAGSPLSGMAQQESGWHRIYADEVAEVYERRP